MRALNVWCGVMLAAALSGCATQLHVHAQAISAAAPTVTQPTHRLVHFAFAKDTLVRAENSKVRANAEWMHVHPDAVMLLEGHTDAVGGADYNVALGDRRARHVAAGLMQNGVDPTRLAAIVSYGKTRPLCRTNSRSAGRCNRRVEMLAR